MKTLIRFNIVITAQNCFNILEALEEIRFNEQDPLELKTNVSKWLNKALKEEAIDSLNRKFALFMTDKLYPLSQFKSLIEKEVDTAAKETAKSIYLSRKNSVEDVPTFILDEEIVKVEYLAVSEINTEPVVASYILPVYILTDKKLEGLFRKALIIIKSSSDISNFKRSLLIERLLTSLAKARVATLTNLVTANMSDTPSETYEEASGEQRNLKNSIIAM